MFEVLMAGAFILLVCFFCDLKEEERQLDIEIEKAKEKLKKLG